MAVIIYGAGGHARVLLELVERGGIGPITGFVDDDPATHGTKIEAFSVLGPIAKVATMIRPYHISRAIIAVGDNAARQRLAEHARSLGLRLSTVIHPSAVISPSASVGEGTAVLAGAIVSAHSKIGEACILNTGSIVDHDCQIGDYVHIAPGAKLCGGVTIGDSTLVGAGATVIPEIIIGSESTVGAGATVIRDVPSRVTVVGCPARELPAKTPPPPAEQPA